VASLAGELTCAVSRLRAVLDVAEQLAGELGEAVAPEAVEDVPAVALRRQVARVGEQPEVARPS
jgi:hypothetical protein